MKVDYRPGTGVNLMKYEAMYDGFDEGHNREHMERVRNTAVMLARVHAPETTDMAWVAATLHDIGLVEGRDGHETRGADMVERDEYLARELGGFHPMVVEAVRQHRASTGRPTSVLGRIVSDADRSAVTTAYAVYRSVSYARREHPGASRSEWLMRALEHHREKYSPGAYGRRVYFPETTAILDREMTPILGCVIGEDLLGLLSPEDRARVESVLN